MHDTPMALITSGFLGWGDHPTGWIPLDPQGGHRPEFPEFQRPEFPEAINGGELIYVTTANNAVAAVDLAGKIRWFVWEQA